MANTFPANKVLSSEKFADFKNVAAQISRYTHDFSSDIADGHTAVTLWWQNAATASVWDSTNGFQHPEEQISSTDIIPTEPVYKGYSMTPNEHASFGDEFMVKRAGPAVIAVLNRVKTDAQNCLTSSQFPLASANAAISASAMSFDAVQSGSNILINSGSVGGLTLLASSNAYSALIREAKNANYAITSQVTDGQPSFRYALLPHLLIVQEPSMTSYSVMTTPDAVGIALRQTVQLKAYDRTVVVDPDLGITIALDYLEDGPNGKPLGRANVIAGYAVGKPGTAVRYYHGST